jgi:uncharacterized protein YwqG
MSEHDRRSFFKALLRDAASAAQEFRSAFQPPEEVFAPPEPFELPPPRRATPSAGPLDEEALRKLCRELGLEARTDDVLRLARRSVRLTPGPDDPVGAGTSRLGGVPNVPRGFEWPTWNDRRLAFVGQLRLEEIAATGCAGPLPAEGLLLFFYDLATLPSGKEPSHRGSCRVMAVEGEALTQVPGALQLPILRTMPVELSGELMLPSAWSFHAEKLELEPEEAEAWDRLRARVAEAQRVELEDATAEWFALHRLLGYQEELGRETELDCELAAAGISSEDYDVYFEHRESHEDAAREWRLLLQVSTDPELRTPWDAFGRLCIFLRDADLQAGKFDAAWAILR